MSLTRTQYNEIKAVLSAREKNAREEQRLRQEEAERAIPALVALKEELFKLNTAELKARFIKDKKASKAAVSGIKKQREDILKTKAELLKEYGYRADYLDIKYTCKKCQDTGYVGNEKCICFKSLEAELINRDAGLPGFLNCKDLKHLDTRIYDNSAPMQDLPRGVKALSQLEYMKERIIPEAVRYVEGFDEPGSHNIFMCGPSGTGKTYLSASIAKSLIGGLHTVIYVSAIDLFDMYRNVVYDKQGSDEDRGRIEKIEESDLLIIDDLGTENISDFSVSRMFNLISHRLSAGKSTIISSNKDLNEISEIYGDRIASRIQGSFKIFRFFGVDLRLRTHR
ncbi:MAG: ATP-binding protein [Eubacteriales bacterium]|nr:ATP-binding protein [Eubacteriales bacterium]